VSRQDALVPIFDVVPADAATVPAEEAARIWRELAGGRCQVLVAADQAGERRVVVALMGDSPRADWSGLTARERQVVVLASRGVSQKVIAIDLRLGTSTVSQVLRRVRERFGFASLTELTRAFRA
jgi:DNA-binding NarL/FixJ family response regulator